MLTFKVCLFPVCTFTTVLDNYQDSAFNSYITDPPLCFPSDTDSKSMKHTTAAPHKSVSDKHHNCQKQKDTNTPNRRTVLCLMTSSISLFCISAVHVGSWLLSKLCQQQVATRSCQTYWPHTNN